MRLLPKEVRGRASGNFGIGTPVALVEWLPKELQARDGWLVTGELAMHDRYVKYMSQRKMI
jgi:hypothetical protein